MKSHEILLQEKGNINTIEHTMCLTFLIHTKHKKKMTLFEDLKLGCDTRNRAQMNIYLIHGDGNDLLIHINSLICLIA